MRPYPLCYDPGWSSKVPVDSNRIVTEFFKRHENFQSFLCTFHARLMSPAPLQFQKATTSNQCVYLLAGGTMPLLACHLFHILAHQGSAKRRERHPAAARGTLKPTTQLWASCSVTPTPLSAAKSMLTSAASYPTTKTRQAAGEATPASAAIGPPFSYPPPPTSVRTWLEKANIARLPQRGNLASMDIDGAYRRIRIHVEQPCHPHGLPLVRNLAPSTSTTRAPSPYPGSYLDKKQIARRRTCLGRLGWWPPTLCITVAKTLRLVVVSSRN